MKVDEHGARLLFIQMLKLTFADLRMLYRAGYLNENIELTRKAILARLYKPELVTESKHVSKAALAMEVIGFLKSRACKSLLEKFGIEAEPMECARKTIQNHRYICEDYDN